MFRRALFLVACVLALGAFGATSAQAQQAYGAPGYQAYGQTYGSTHNTQDWQRFYHYPYVYYPQNFAGPEYMNSSPDMYHRYPPEMRIPVYNKAWQNYYPQPRKYHRGHHFILDVF